MGQGTTHVALDDSKRRIVAGILRPGATEPVLVCPRCGEAIEPGEPVLFEHGEILHLTCEPG